MRHLLALLQCGTRGTHAEPKGRPRGIIGKSAPVPHVTSAGTLEIRGTLEIEQAATVDDLVQHVADLHDAYHECIAIVMEASEISMAAAEATAALEVGQELVRRFSRDGSAP